MKKTIIISSLSLLFVTGCSLDKENSSASNNSSNTSKSTQIDDNRTVISSHGKYTSLASDLDELENSSPIIVEVTKNSEEQTVKKESDKNTIPTEFYTMSEVTIKDIQKDTTKSLKNGDKIKVLESVATNVPVEGKKRTLTVDNYKKMEIGKSYYLYLRDSTSGDNYVLTNAFLSKFPAKEEAKNKLFLSEDNVTESIEDTDYKDLYEEVYSDVLEENK
ncbi:hypothetical protein [Listeria booriae]|uniref:Lipoprotein n=1 Tax=Listeria booriae TaxID=1552123 RepID=A0A7X0XL32_9LIST|nr:hypothetical protein [Listeria booriae]MBC1562967.1 hypothetical protein [Listeria booriae]MBC1574762.1 hypothetical protein [Listeria booriae]MBC2244561.1 hypothetical protein [Listeria booriae]MBC2676140.1 hypothetical protein [Listeria booriae]